ncbi:MAG: hypothetical protein ACMXYK_03885 [Candidatus Woesearchaeota archaeon]
MAINNIYVEGKDQVQQAFDNNPEFKLVSFNDFFTQDALIELFNTIEMAQYVKTDNILEEHLHKAPLAESDLPPGFIAYCKEIIGDKNVTSIQALKLSWKDYSLLSDDVFEKGIHAIIGFSEWDEKQGGGLYYMHNNEPLLIPTTINAVTLIDANDMKSFIQYVNHYAEEVGYIVKIVFE